MLKQITFDDEKVIRIIYLSHCDLRYQNSPQNIINNKTHAILSHIYSIFFLYIDTIHI